MSEMYNVHNFGLSVFRPWGNSGGEVTPAPYRYPPTHTLCTLYITSVVGSINVAVLKG
jgi:hypothetical protein